MNGETTEELLARLRSLDYRGAIVGPKGTGKTRLLEVLEPALIALKFGVKRLRLDDRTRSFAPEFLSQFFEDVTSEDVILFDGAERMRWLAWRRFKSRSKNAGGLVITCHKPGMLPTLRECATSPALLGDIVNELLGSETAVVRDGLAELHRRHNGNLRDALREMYDRCAAQTVQQANRSIERRTVRLDNELGV